MGCSDVAVSKGIYLRGVSWSQHSKVPNGCAITSPGRTKSCSIWCGQFNGSTWQQSGQHSDQLSLIFSSHGSHHHVVWRVNGKYVKSSLSAQHISQKVHFKKLNVIHMSCGFTQVSTIKGCFSFRELTSWSQKRTGDRIWGHCIWETKQVYSKYKNYCETRAVSLAECNWHFSKTQFHHVIVWRVNGKMWIHHYSSSRSDQRAAQHNGDLPQGLHTL